MSLDDKEGKYFLSVDLGVEKYEFMSELKGERDMWYESLKNSRKTAKEIKNSITKKPRNIAKISKIIEKEGVDKLREFCDKEREKLSGNYSDM